MCVVERVHVRIMMRGGGRGGGQMCMVERVHARIMMRGGGEGIHVCVLCVVEKYMQE